MVEERYSTGMIQMVSKATASRIGKLAEIAQELRKDKRFEITRLTKPELSVGSHRQLASMREKGNRTHETIFH